jgi:hypothetical protein
MQEVHGKELKEKTRRIISDLHAKIENRKCVTSADKLTRRGSKGVTKRI